jgi:transporter family-2 protein
VLVAGFGAGRLGLVSADRTALVPWWAWPAGACGAIYLLSQPLVAPRLGAGAYMGLSVTAQLVGALVLDHFALLGLPEHPASLPRIVGALLMGAGVMLVTRY